MNAAARLVPCVCCGQPTLADPQQILDSIAIAALRRTLANRLARSFGTFVGRDVLIDALYALRADGGPDSAVDILKTEIYYLRKQLLLSPLAVESVRGGYRLTWRRVGDA